MVAAGAASVSALPAGTRVLHIGPHKTGTTAVQSAFHRARGSLAEQGVHYAGPDRHAVTAVQGAIETPGAERRRIHPIRSWRRLLAEVRRATADRVVISSEWFADAEPPAIRRIVEELGPAPVHVVVTVRSFVRLLPSQWQQYVKAGLALPYEAWLDAVLNEPEPAVTPTFWLRHRHDQLVSRWAEVVGPASVTVIVLDETDRDYVMRSFESILSLRSGTLVPEEARRNRSLTFPEVELIRALNVRLQAEVDDPNLRLNLGLYGAAAALESAPPDPTDPGIETPGWAVERALEIGHEIGSGIAGCGVRVIGDLSTLAEAPAAGEESRAAGAAAGPAGEPSLDPWTVWPRLAATAGLGVLVATGLGRGAQPASARISTAELLRPLSTLRLGRVAVERTRDALRHLARGWRTSGGRAPMPPAARPATRGEQAMADRFRQLLLAEGVAARRADRVVDEGVVPELQRRQQVRPDEAPSPESAATLLLGIVRASGLIQGGARRVPPPRARIETAEIARVPTPALLVVIAGRLAANALGRLRPAGAGSEP